jgi:hypothetical protein
MTTKKPRRQTRMNPRAAAFVGGLWLIAGMGELVLGITAGSAWYVVLGSLWVLCSLLWSIDALHERRRVARGAGAEPQGRRPAS